MLPSLDTDNRCWSSGGLAFLHQLLPRLVRRERTFQVHPFQGKGDPLGKLEARLRGYASWLPADWRILVVVGCR
jgi:hypothetical protein